MNQGQYINLVRKRKRTAKELNEEREKSLKKNTEYSGALNLETREYERGTKRNKLGTSRLAPTKKPETIRDRIANKLDEGYGSSGDFHEAGTKKAVKISGSVQTKSMKHKGRSR